MSITRQSMAAIRLLLVCTVLLGVGYPAAAWAVGRIAFSDQVAGSLLTRDGQVVGSSLLGQDFTAADQFHSRPSASDYAGDISGGTNLYAAAADQQQAITQRQSARGAAGDLNGGVAAPDALTASASGLDPHISPAFAMAQVPRVAKATGLGLAEITAMVDRATSGRTLGFLGQPRVNVVALNESLAAARR